MKSMVFLFFILLSTENSFAKPIKVTSVSELDFGTGAPGDSSKQVLAGTTETSSNGSFAVDGDNNRAFSIVLPTAATIETGKGPNRDTIAITSFQSYPAGNSVLNGSGDRTVFVGATRASLKLSQKAGLYSGSYSITVVY